MKKFTEIREAKRSAQDRLSARASKHGLGSQKRLDKIKKSADFFSKPPPSFSKDELKKMGYAVEGKKFKDVKNLTPDEKRVRNRNKVKGGTSSLDDRLSNIRAKGQNEASSPAQQAAIAIAKKANQVMSLESIDEATATNVNKIRAAYRDFMKKKGKNFEEIAMSLTMIANRMTRDDYKSEKIIKDESSRIQGIVNKTYSTEEGKEIRALLIKHKIYGNGSPVTAIQKLTWE